MTNIKQGNSSSTPTTDVLKAKEITSAQAADILAKLSVTIDEQCPKINDAARSLALKLNDNFDPDTSAITLKYQAETIAEGHKAIKALGNAILQEATDVDTKTAASQSAIQICTNAGYIK